jgi:hypothetical protein
MDGTPRVEQWDEGCCSWIDGCLAEEGELLETRSQATFSFMEEGKRAGPYPFGTDSAVRREPAVIP